MCSYSPSTINITAPPPLSLSEGFGLNDEAWGAWHPVVLHALLAVGLSSGSWDSVVQWEKKSKRSLTSLIGQDWTPGLVLCSYSCSQTLLNFSFATCTMRAHPCMVVLQRWHLSGAWCTVGPFLPAPFFLTTGSENRLSSLKLPSRAVLKTTSTLLYFDLFFLNYFLFQHLDSFLFNKHPLLLSNMTTFPTFKASH